MEEHLMKSLILTCVVFSPALFLVAGCNSVMRPITELNRETMQIFKPKPFDADWSGEEEIDQWSYVGDEARGDRPKESDPDGWWQKYVMSNKARNIERNLGIE
ncbi:MAG TPA: hypothetical protein DCM07_24920 [Planctomycetaceae bacterium]|nr:hypothetical protein [Planctomycetaceae bacterium]|tara:strand:+ start:3787 stop:4095 length:309 start_codon:yes stop_codon:yes gene_type:complete